MYIFRQIAIVEYKVLEEGICGKWRGEERGREEFAGIRNRRGGGFREGELGGNRRWKCSKKKEEEDAN